MGIESDVEIGRCHRIGSRKTKTGQDRDQPRIVVCRLNRFKDKQRILNKIQTTKSSQKGLETKSIDENFNKYFTQIGTNLEKDIGTSTKSFNEYINRHGNTQPEKVISVN